MNELKKYVDELFSKYSKNKSTNDLKLEVLSNLEAKKADLIASGVDEKTATIKAIENIKNVDNLIDGNRNVYIKQFQLESLQVALLYSVIIWLVTIPAIIFRPFFIMNSMLLLSVIVIGVIYLIKNSNKSNEYVMTQKYLNINYFIKLKVTAWIVWIVFVVACIFKTTGIHFASNMWFSRLIKIDGPYQFAIILSDYLAPFFTIVIPLIINKLPKLLQKHEVGENNEK